jgi:DNA-binding PadR family transcriptional regulator
MLSTPRPRPTTTLYGVLGLLAVRPMSNYELAKHFDRSLGRLWPRARSKLFEAPKKLEALGLARATKGRVGLRPRTVYTITPKGRRALAAWLHEPGSGPELEFEQLLKVFFADHGTKEAAAANIEAARDWARTQIDEHIAVGRSYLEGAGTFQERFAVNQITGSFHARFALTVERWATWALGVVESWPEDPRRAVPDTRSIEQLLLELETVRTTATGVEPSEI